MDSIYVKQYISILNELSLPPEQGTSRFANTADFYDNGIEGPDGQRTTIDTSTGKVKTAGMGGSEVTSVQGTPISRTTPNLTGATVKTYTGSAQGKGIASGGQKLAYDSGPMQAKQYKDPAGKQTSANMSYDMGIAKANVNQQGDENAPTQTSMQYVQPDGSYGENPPVQEGDYELEEMRRLAYGTSDDIVEDPDSTGVETRQATLNTPVGDFTANITKDKSTNTVSGTMPVGGTTLRATKDMTPGGAQSFSVDTDVTPNLNLSATKKSADYNKGQLAGTKSVAAKYTDATGALGQPGQQHTATRTVGVGFGGASGARVGKNYVDQYSVNEMKEDDLDAMRRIMNHRR